LEQNPLIPAEALIPHGLGMRLITGVKRSTQKGLVAETTVSEAWPLNRDGRVSSVIGIELVAQTISALSTYRRGEGARPRIGLLVGVKEAEFSLSGIPSMTRLTVRVEELYRLGNYAVFEGKVSTEQALICSVVLQVMEPEGETVSNLVRLQRIVPREEGGRGGP